MTILGHKKHGNTLPLFFHQNPFVRVALDFIFLVNKWQKFTRKKNDVHHTSKKRKKGKRK
jgi:hypothetical protein